MKKPRLGAAAWIAIRRRGGAGLHKDKRRRARGAEKSSAIKEQTGT